MKYSFKNFSTRFKGYLSFVVFFFIISRIEIVRELFVHCRVAVSTEFCTLQKRPNYKEYQYQANRFFLGPQKSVQNNNV